MYLFYMENMKNLPKHIFLKMKNHFILTKKKLERLEIMRKFITKHESHLPVVPTRLEFSHCTSSERAVSITSVRQGIRVENLRRSEKQIIILVLSLIFPAFIVRTRNASNGFFLFSLQTL